MLCLFPNTFAHATGTKNAPVSKKFLPALGQETDGVINRNAERDTEYDGRAGFERNIEEPIKPAVIMSANKLGMSEIIIIRALAKMAMDNDNQDAKCQHQTLRQVVDQNLFLLINIFDEPWCSRSHCRFGF